MKLYPTILLLVGCAGAHTPTPANDNSLCEMQLEALRGDCACDVVPVFDEDCRMQVLASCEREADIFVLQVTRYPQTNIIDLGVEWNDGSTCKTVLREVAK